MSDSEDFNILADIHALEEALVLDIKDKQKQQQYDCDEDSLSSDYFSSITSTGREIEEDNEEDYFYTNQDIDAESLNICVINKRLIIGLTLVKKKLITFLQDCEQKIKILDAKITKTSGEKMIKSTDTSNLRIRCPINIIGMPYFKDKNNFPAPKNSDTKLKDSRGELQLLSLKKPSRWSKKDRDILLRAVHNQAIESILSTNIDSEMDNEHNKEKQNNQNKNTKLILPKNLNELIGGLGEKKFDWYKISVIDFDSKHSPEECQTMWNVYLHPQFRKSQWTSAEDRRLLHCVKQHQFQDWDNITLKLGTNRSAYQCFIRYNTIKSVPSTGRAWSKAEDKHLVKIINSLKIGDYIPWSEIATYLWHRPKQQIYTRWMYRKAPHLRKGRFTSLETETLLKAMKKYGKDFSKISNLVMPNRTSMQLSEHYYTLIRNQNHGKNTWTIDDDLKLIELHKTHGNDWSYISTHFCHKTRTQLRHRYNALVKYAKKGTSIECIPRQQSASCKDTSINDTLVLECHNKNKSILKKVSTIDIIDIQLRLYETFCFSPSTKVTNSQLYHLEELKCETKKLYNVLNLLNVNLDIPHDFLNYIHVNKKEKQLLISLEEYINKRNNRVQNDEIIENLRLQMFGNNQNVNENFIPPVPFCGHTRKRRKVQSNVQQCIDYTINFNERFLVDTCIEFSETPAIEPFISVEERNQFDKFNQFLTNYYYGYERQNINLHKSDCSFSFGKNQIKDTTKDCYIQIEQANNSQEITEYFHKDNEKTRSCNVLLPNRATLLGFKNLLLWKLLYEYQNESDESNLIEDYEQSDQTMTNHSEQSNEYKRAYELLRARLYQLFKFPISLSNTMLEIRDFDTIFLSEKTNQQTSEKISSEKKCEDTDPVQPNEKVKVNILADNNFQQNTNTTNLPVVHNSKVTYKYKIIKK